MGFGASNFDVEDIVGDVDDQSLREELESCKHFLTHTEMVNGRHRVFNFAMSSFDMSLLNDKLDYVFKELKCAAKVNLAFGVVDRKPPTGAEDFSYLQSLWENNNMQNFSDFLKWYDNKDVVPTPEAMQKMIEFYHNKGIDMLKLGRTLPNMANICLDKSTDSKF